MRGLIREMAGMTKKYRREHVLHGSQYDDERVGGSRSCLTP